MSSALDPREKIFDRSEIVRRFGKPRSDVVAFTNGCFDILHRGHVAYLCAARALGDRLVVGLNTDASVRRIKGPDRPVSAEADRAFVLAGLACVDAVTLFGEDTPAALIRALVPDILVKGGDYDAEDVVGRDVVEANGGRLVIIPLLPGLSTTGILQRIRT